VQNKQTARVRADKTTDDTNLLRRDVERHRTKIDFHKRVGAWHNTEQSYNATPPLCQHTAQPHAKAKKSNTRLTSVGLELISVSWQSARRWQS